MGLKPNRFFYFCKISILGFLSVRFFSISFDDGSVRVGLPVLFFLSLLPLLFHPYSFTRTLLPVLFHQYSFTRTHSSVLFYPFYFSLSILPFFFYPCSFTRTLSPELFHPYPFAHTLLMKDKLFNSSIKSKSLRLLWTISELNENVLFGIFFIIIIVILKVE